MMLPEKDRFFSAQSLEALADDAIQARGRAIDFPARLLPDRAAFRGNVDRPAAALHADGHFGEQALVMMNIRRVQTVSIRRIYERHAASRDLLKNRERLGFGRAPLEGKRHRSITNYPNFNSCLSK